MGAGIRGLAGDHHSGPNSANASPNDVRSIRPPVEKRATDACWLRRNSHNGDTVARPFEFIASGFDAQAHHANLDRNRFS